MPFLLQLLIQQAKRKLRAARGKIFRLPPQASRLSQIFYTTSGSLPGRDPINILTSHSYLEGVIFEGILLESITQRRQKMQIKGRPLQDRPFTKAIQTIWDLMAVQLARGGSGPFFQNQTIFKKRSPIRNQADPNRNNVLWHNIKQSTTHVTADYYSEGVPRYLALWP